jgi:hypothetical protein
VCSCGWNSANAASISVTTTKASVLRLGGRAGRLLWLNFFRGEEQHSERTTLRHSSAQKANEKIKKILEKKYWLPTMIFLREKNHLIFI